MVYPIKFLRHIQKRRSSYEHGYDHDDIVFCFGGYGTGIWPVKYLVELCHFYEANLSSRFRLHVSEYYPKYKEARRRLRE